jgi:hypothetical protein
VSADAIDWPDALDELDRAVEVGCEPVEIPRPPFRIGQRIYDRKRPTAGSVEVVGCDPYPGGGWCVEARDGNYRTVAPAEHYRACPPDWTEPPSPPDLGAHFYLGVGGSRIGWARMQAEEIPEYRMQVSQWQSAMERWLRAENREAMQ